MAERIIARRRMFSNGRVTIPKEVRDKLELRPGDEVEFVPIGAGRLRIVKVVPKAAKRTARD